MPSIAILLWLKRYHLTVHISNYPVKREYKNWKLCIYNFTMKCVDFLEALLLEILEINSILLSVFYKKSNNQSTAWIFNLLIL